MTDKPYPNEALTEVCELLLDDFGLTLKQIANLAGNLHSECEAIKEDRNEAAWERQQQSLMESGGPDDSAYRREMREAGRGHLVKP
jgi:hypothetical protein